MHSVQSHCMGVKKKKKRNGHGCHGDECNWCSQYLRTCLDSCLPQREFTAPRHKSAMPCWYTLLASSTNCFQPVNTPWSPENLSSWKLSQSPFFHPLPHFFSMSKCPVQLYIGVTHTALHSLHSTVFSLTIDRAIDISMMKICPKLEHSWSSKKPATDPLIKTVLMSPPWCCLLKKISQNNK